MKSLPKIPATHAGMCRQSAAVVEGEVTVCSESVVALELEDCIYTLYSQADRHTALLSIE